MYETKVILVSLARHAVSTNSKEMYNIIAAMVNAEGIVLKPYEEAKKEAED